MIPIPTSLRTVKGGNPVSAPGGGGNVPLVEVDLDQVFSVALPIYPGIQTHTPMTKPLEVEF